LERAINDSKGVRIKFATYEDAFTFRLRIHKARQLDRSENRDIYEEGHKLYGHSIYDQISCKIREFNGGAWLRLERIDAVEYEVESLSEEPPEPELALKPPPVQALIKDTKTGREELHLVLPIRLRRRI
jgi:hypothetical protein